MSTAINISLNISISRHGYKYIIYRSNYWINDCMVWLVQHIADMNITI